MTRSTKHTKHTHPITVGVLLAAWMSLAPVALASDVPMSPRARALAEDLRKVPVPTAERLERSATPGSPRGKANEVRRTSGTTSDRLDRSVSIGSPRGRETFPGLHWNGR